VFPATALTDPTAPPGPNNPPCVLGTAKCPKQPLKCMVGSELVNGVCRDFNSRVKTVWSEQDAN
jgi:hypothetical protein